MDTHVERINGTLKIVIDGQAFDPLAFRSFRPTRRNVTDFTEAGVRLMSILSTGLDCTLGIPYSRFGETWIGRGQYDFSGLDAQVELFLKNAPDAYFNMMLQLDTRPWWLAEHPECSDSYWNLVEVAGYAPWRQDAAAYLKAVVEHVESKYGERFFAYSLCCGTSTEWYTNSQSSSEEARICYHPLKERAFREYTGVEGATLPSMAALEHTTDGVFRHPIADEAALRYWRFHNNLIADTILYFAEAFQQVNHHRKLLGLFYGYLIALQGTRLLREGHMGYEKVFRCKDIDMIFAPASYGEARAFTGASGFLNTIDSLDLHDKLYFHECDHRTSVAPRVVEGASVVRWGDDDLDQSIMILRREFAMAMAKGVGLWWFDMFEGWFYSDQIMAEIAHMVHIGKRVKSHTLRSISQIAVFGDVESMYYVSETARVNDDTLRNQRDGLNRIGAPYDLYTLSDVDDPRLDHDQYDLYILLNAFKLSQKTRMFVEEEIKAKGKTVLWIYAPGYVTDEGFSVSEMSRCVGIDLQRAEGDPTIVVDRSGLLGSLDGTLEYGFTSAIAPLFCVEDKAATVLGRYKESEEAALAYKSVDGFTSFYSGTGNVPASVLREIARFAGVHVYYEGDDPVYVNNRLIGIHAIAGGKVQLRVPHPVEMEELFDGGALASEGNMLTVPVEPGRVKLYLLQSGEMCPSGRST